MHTIYEVYKGSFEAIVANTKELQDECFKIRFLTFCEESHVLRDSNPYNGEKIECDRYDKHSAHGLLRHRDSGLFIGACRLILNPPGATHGMLPANQYCKLDQPDSQFLTPHHQTAELSRLCISKTRCAQAADFGAGKTLFGPSRFPSMMLGLFHLYLRFSMENSVRYWYAAVEPSLFRHFERLGMRFDKVGLPVEYHGLRQWCHAKVDEWLMRVRDERNDVWDILTDRGTHTRWKSY